ncbi:Thymocyte nuclear protein 1 [Colletotrichum gloeosporioides]|uniref:Thymocyte nuclear protein 1 n=1 Tax=Colletotrichum gloeosporioides TaxID=474922 RepID=A0A8H4C7J0_COLGL|nr:Thymocyte nuclear protein 1 [Colletotrichum gloeosporioides]KAF3798616.1 Thymocyte nuclear protein 1 [Colletotrichum gloeosporioides]
MPAVTRSLRSSTRLSAAAPADEKRTVVEKSKAPAKTKVTKKEATTKTQTEEKTSKAAGAGRKRKAVEAEPEDEPEPKAEVKKPAAKKAKVRFTHIPLNHTHSLTLPQKPAAGKKEAPPRKTKDELKALRDASASVPDVNPDAEERSPPEERYWLMKSEPDVRIEDGYEIKFSIDDLAAKKTPEGWEGTVADDDAGIRNYAARNNLRDMRKGDKAFFYHSNCKEPGIVGIISIVKEHSPDFPEPQLTTAGNACINDNPYYDDAAPHDGSKWSLVHVKIEHRFPRIVPLSLLKEVGPKGPLANMQLLKLGRLSVNKVTKEEWDEVIRMAKELDEDGEWEKAVEEGKKFPNYSAALQHGLDALVQVLDEQDHLDPHQALAAQRLLVRGLVQTLTQPRQHVAQTQRELGRVGADADQRQTDVAVPRRGVGCVKRAHGLHNIVDDLLEARDLGEGGKHVEETLGDVGGEEGLLAGDVEDGHGYGAVHGRVVLELRGGVLVDDLLAGDGQVVAVLVLLVLLVAETDLVVVVHLLARQGVRVLLLPAAALRVHLGQPLHLAARVLDPQRALGRAEPAPAHEVPPRAAHVAVLSGAAAGVDPQVGVGGHHAQGGGHGAAPALGGLDVLGVGEVLEPEVLAGGVAGDGAVVDGEDAGLGGVLGVDVADLHAPAALLAQGVEGGFPFRVGGEVGGVGARGEDAVFEVASFLDDCADFLLWWVC